VPQSTTESLWKWSMWWLRFCDASKLKIFVPSWPQTFRKRPPIFPYRSNKLPYWGLRQAVWCAVSLTAHSDAFTKNTQNRKIAICVPWNQKARRTHPLNTSYKCLDTAVVLSSQKNKQKHCPLTPNAKNHCHPVTVLCLTGRCQNQRSSMTSRNNLKNQWIELHYNSQVRPQTWI
jgi:hypothetical protein